MCVCVLTVQYIFLDFNLEDFPTENRFLMSNELERVQPWLKLNQLTLSLEKTKGMIFFINALNLIV